MHVILFFFYIDHVCWPDGGNKEIYICIYIYIFDLKIHSDTIDHITCGIFLVYLELMQWLETEIEIHLYEIYTDGLRQDWSNSIGNALRILGLAFSHWYVEHITIHWNTISACQVLDTASPASVNHGICMLIWWCKKGDYHIFMKQIC